MTARQMIPARRSGATLQRSRVRAAAGLVALGLLLLASGAGAETLTVQVRDGDTQAPLPGAFVMVGPVSGFPFAGNYGWTDGAGTILFDHPVLANPQTVTAGADGYGYLTLCDAALGQITLTLYPPEPDTLMGGTRTHVEGEVLGIATVSNDGQVDAAIIAPAVSPSDFVFGDRLKFRFGMELVPFPLIGDVLLPENVFIPTQTEYIFMTFSKSPWRIDVPAGLTTFVSVAARIPLTAFVGGNPLAEAVVREVGVERDVSVSSPMNLDIDSDLDLGQDLDVEFVGVPASSALLTVSGARISGPAGELMVGFDTRMANVDSIASFTMATRAPGGDLSDAVNIAVGAYMDSSLAVSYHVGIIERDGFLPPHEIVFWRWMNLPGLTQNDREFSWTDPTNPGISPSPTWTRSNLGLRPVDPANLDVPVRIYWRLYARADAGEFTLPVLPEVAPGPPGGLPDPAGTPEDDLLYWSLWAANPPDDPQAAVAGLLDGATHWTSRWVEIQLPASAVPGEELPAGRTTTLRIAPNPGSGPVRIAWQTAAGGPGLLEVHGPDGRQVARRTVNLSRGSVYWQGRDEHGRPLPAGLYWVRLRSGKENLGRAPLLWVQ
jgi:hypothetical protein